MIHLYSLGGTKEPASQSGTGYTLSLFIHTGNPIHRNNTLCTTPNTTMV